MANIYENQLEVYGESSVVDVIKSNIIGEDGQIDLGILVPETERSTDWRYLNWGTKWIEQIAGFGANITESVGSDDKKSLTLYFNSANGSPTEWFKELCKRFGNKDTSLQLTYADPGSMTGGWMYNDDEGGYLSDLMEDSDVVVFCDLEDDMEEDF